MYPTHRTTLALAVTALALGAFARPANAQGTYNNTYLGGGIWEQDANWSITVYAHNGRTRPDANGNPIPDPNPQYNAIINTAPCVLSIGVNVLSLNVGAAGALALGQNGSINAGAGGILNNGGIALGNGTRLRGAATLNGITSLNSTGSGSHLEFGNGSVVNGQVLMSNNATNYTSGVNHGDTVTIAQSGIVRGAGQLNVGFFGDTEHMANWVNHGLIEGNQANALIISLANSVNSHLTNDGTIRATGGATVHVRHLSDAGQMFNTGGVIEAQDGSVFQLNNGVTLEGGTLTTSGSGKIGGNGSGGGSGTYKNVTNAGTMAVGNNEMLRLAGTITNNGAIRMNSTQNTGANLYFNNNTVLGGTGALLMSNSSTNYIYATASGDNVTLAAGATMQGAANINPGFSGTGLMNFTNNGLVDANQPAGINFRLATAAGANVTNNGIMRASNGGTLRFYNGSAADLVTNTNGRIEALDGSTVRLAAAVTLDGGILATSGSGAIRGDAAGGGSGTYLNVTNTGTMAIADNETMRIAGNFTHNGVLRMDGTSGTGVNLYFSNGTTIGGSGTISMTASGTNYIYGNNHGDTLSIGSGITLRGGCQISPAFSGTGILQITNAGLIESTSYIRIALHDAGNANMVNTGTLRAAAGATLELHAFSQGTKLTNNGGLIELLDAAKLTAHSALQLLQTSGTISLNAATMTVPFGIDLNGGQLIGNGTITGPVRNNGGSVAPGFSPGKITIEGNYTQGADGVLNMEIGGNTPGSGYDQLRVIGTATLGGTLNLKLINGFNPRLGDVFEIIDPNAVAGEFARINAEGFGVQANYAAGGITVTVTSVPDRLLNISTRLRVGTGENALIGGFIITGSEPKKVIIRAIGPSLGAQGVAGVLANPTLELFDGAGNPIAFNNNWKDSQQGEIEASTIPPGNDLEAAIVRTFDPGNYTAVVRGQDDTTGIGLVEVYDLGAAAQSKLANISSRGFVETGENVLIGGFIVGGGGQGTRVVVRAVGPSLGEQGVAGALQDPTLQLVDANGSEIRANDNWEDGQRAELEALQIQPANDLESAVIASLNGGNYTAIIRGTGDSTGVGLVEVYNVE